MAQFIGIDYGGAAVKAALSIDGRPSESLKLGTDVFLPCVLPSGCAHDGEQNPNVATLESIFRAHQFATGVHSVGDFRDRLETPTGVITNSGWTAKAIPSLTWLWTVVRRTLGIVSPDVTGLAVSVPDHWSESEWSLPIALRNAGLGPQILVYESLAAMIGSHRPLTETLAISAGVSGLRLSRVTVDGDYVGIASHQYRSQFGGRSLRSDVADWLAERVVNSTRRDPREDERTDCVLRHAANLTVDRLRRKSQAGSTITVFGKEVEFSLSRSDLPHLLGTKCQKIRDYVVEFAKSQNGVKHCLLWGETAELFPFHQWLQEVGIETFAAPIDVVARGAAELCGDVSLGKRPVHPRQLIALRTTDGKKCKWQAEFRTEDQYLALLDKVSVVNTAAEATSLNLIGPDEQKKVVLHVDSLRLGRDPRCDVVFPQDRYPMVSGEHAVLIRDGSDFLLRDLGSSNGTFLNGRQVEEEEQLRNGDEIQLGRTGPRLLFKTPQRDRGGSHVKSQGST